VSKPSFDGWCDVQDTMLVALGQPFRRRECSHRRCLNRHHQITMTAADPATLHIFERPFSSAVVMKWRASNAPSSRGRARGRPGHRAVDASGYPRRAALAIGMQRPEQRAGEVGAVAGEGRPCLPFGSITIWRPLLRFGALLNELNKQATQRPVFDAHECLRQIQSIAMMLMSRRGFARGIPSPFGSGRGFVHEHRAASASPPFGLQSLTRAGKSACIRLQPLLPTLCSRVAV
jgi:hypothetical protein